MKTTVPVCLNRSEEHTSELQSPCNLVCRLLLEKKKKKQKRKKPNSKYTQIDRSHTHMPYSFPSSSPTYPCSPSLCLVLYFFPFFFFFFNDTATTEIYTLSLHDALPICWFEFLAPAPGGGKFRPQKPTRSEEHTSELQSPCNLVCRLLLEKKKNKHT